MLHKEEGNKKTMFELKNNKQHTVVTNTPKTSRSSGPTPKTSAYDRVVQLVANDNTESVSQQQPQGPAPTKQVHIVV